MPDSARPILLYPDSSSNGSSCISNGDSFSPEFTAPELSSFKKLSDNLGSLFHSPDFGCYSDAKIITVEGREVDVHKCVLAARSPVFRQIFAEKERENKYELKELAKDFNVGYDALVSVLEYVYSGKVKSIPSDIGMCVDEGCPHEACRPVVDFCVEVLYAAYTFQIAELTEVWKIYLLEILDKVEEDDILIILSLAYICDKENGRLLTKCMNSIVKSGIDTTALEKALPQDIVKLIADTREKSGFLIPGNHLSPSKHVRRIYRALDSDDIELIRLLLKEGHTTLDDAYALHYAVAYCDAKTTTELLDIGLADVNLRNPRGYTVLHIAALRKEPKIIVSLLTKGARPTDLAPDGRKALQISKRLTRSANYFRMTKEGNASPKERLCIEVLEQAERRDPQIGEASVSLAMAGENLRSRLLYLENRVGLARLLFPAEAKVAMDIARVESTPEFSLSKVDLNDSPFIMKAEHLARMKALSRTDIRSKFFYIYWGTNPTVELGKRFFPRCSEVLNQIVDDDDVVELAFLSDATTEEHLKKKKRYRELQEQLAKAFTEDKQANDRSMLPSSAPMERGRSKLARR